MTATLTATQQRAQQVRSKSRAQGVAGLLVAVLVFSWGAPIIRFIDLPSQTITVWRLAIGGGALLLAALVTGTPWPTQRREVVAGGVFFGVHLLCFAYAAQHTSIAVLTLTGSVQPLLVALLSARLVGERVPRALVGWSACALAGVALVVSANPGAGSRTALGDVAAVVTTLLFIAYFVFAKRARGAGAPALTFTASVYGVALLVTAPTLLLTTRPAPTTASAWGLVALLALVPGNGHLLINWAHSRVSAALSSLVLAALPLVASVWALLLFDEPFGWRQAAGMALVLFAIDRGRRVERDRSRIADAEAAAAS